MKLSVISSNCSPVPSSSTKALLYVRVSSLDQEKEGYSLDAQEKLGFDYARRKGFEIVRTWKISESAWRSERSAFGAMIEFAKRHDEIGHIIFDVTDRMTRNDFDKMKMYGLVREYGKTIHFSRSNKVFNRESGSDDEFMFDIEVAVAKKMSNDISRKSQMGMVEKAEQGFYPSAAPIGYRNNLVTHLIDLVPEQAAFVRRAFELMASGDYSLDLLREKLTKEGFRNKNGGPIGKPSLYHILRNRIYYGSFEWKGRLYQGSHAAIIDKATYDRAQAVMTRRFHPNRNKRDFAFNNLIQCGVCGCKVLGEQKKGRYTYYHCTFTKGRHERRFYVPERALASRFEETINRITLPPEIAAWLNEVLEEQVGKVASLQERRLGALRTQLDKAEKRLSRLYDARFDGEMPDEMFRAKEREYQAEVAELKAQVRSAAELDVETVRPRLNALELSKSLHTEFLRSNPNEKAQILKSVASNFTLDGENLSPTYKKPFDLLAKGLACSNWLPGLDSNQQPSR
jgi:site-specific DNA recombinase